MRIWRQLCIPWEIGGPHRTKRCPVVGGTRVFWFWTRSGSSRTKNLKNDFQSARWDHAGGAKRVFGAIVAARGVRGSPWDPKMPRGVGDVGVLVLDHVGIVLHKKSSTPIFKVRRGAPGGVKRVFGAIVAARGR